ncbi:MULTISPECIES: PadR family transcriptional regulator [Paenibacillus]|uniref:PadR family transcriptional regulator n=1 Tax=Paenibacillus TaxID=44249 RepID=UPI000491B486|nr:MULTISPECIES: PadR family transcriptional regulator [Paenibacillus]ALA40811.1 PadR family transcriptional regulator [Paenibacillus peoriae]SFR25651.1 Virulence activator alpha C-term [Paenibacillus sp. cl130]
MLIYVILGFLCEKDMTGYEIKQKMTISTSNFIDASFGSIYPMLKKMEKGELIKYEEVVEEGRFKKSYGITEKGKSEFIEWLKTPCTFSPFNYEYLSKLFFYKYLDDIEVVRLIASFQTTVACEYNKLALIEEKHVHEMDVYEHATLMFGKEYFQMIMNWHDELTRKITGKKDNEDENDKEI